jgi:CDP-glucose 4,6-dehydratase
VSAIDHTGLPQAMIEPSSAFRSVYAGKKVFVTGHTGFKGSWLCEWLLLLGAKVFGYSIDCTEQSLFSQLKLQERVHDVRGDVRNLAALREAVSAVKPEFVFHLAAQSLVRRSYTEPLITFTTNVIGSVNVMEVIRTSLNRCVAIMITTDKCYKNPEGLLPCSENDPLGGRDPYSASKAAAEIAIDAYRRSFCRTDQDGRRIAIASARTGNVIGGGDWAADRILPDCVRALQRSEPILVRNENSTRPWQHVLEPLSGYLLLGQKLWKEISAENIEQTRCKELSSAFNFGPLPGSDRAVRDLVTEVLRHWPGRWFPEADATAPHEARRLNLSINKAFHLLGWRPVWDFSRAVAETVVWYRAAASKSWTELPRLTQRQIGDYTQDAAIGGACWV